MSCSGTIRSSRWWPARRHWEETGLFSALLRQAAGKPYAELISLVDTPEQATPALGV
jgi:hypothetical protein